MTTSLKNVIYAIVGIVVGIGIGYIAFHGQYKLVGSISPTPSFQADGQQFAQTSLNTSATTSTSTSIFNNQYDRALTGLYAYCTGASAGSASAFTVTVSTSSIASFNSTTAAIATLTISSSTPQTYATSTNFTAGSGYWPQNTWLQFNFNATNTATCVVGAQAIQL